MSIASNSFIKKHYAQVITACCFMFLFVNVGFPSTSISVYQPYIAELPGIGHAGASAVLTTRALVTLITLTVVDKVIARTGIRLAVALSCVLTGAAFICYGFSSSLPGFLAGSVLAGMGYAFGGMVCMTVLLNRWFTDNVGTAIGIATVGSGAAGVVVPLMATFVIHAVSLSASFFAEGICAVGIGVLLFLVIRNSPQEMGLTPHVSSGKAGKRRSHSHESSRVPIPRGIRYGLYFAIVLIGISAIGGQTFFSILMTSQGVDPVIAGSLVALESFCLVLGKIFAGRAFDRFGGQWASAIFFGIMIAGLVLCCLISAEHLVIAGLAAVFYGAGISLATVGISVWSLELSDEERKLKNVKRFQVAYNAGGVTFSLVPGVLMEACGNYTVSYEIMLASAVLCAFLILCAYAWKKKNCPSC